ncbi:MAG TPA: hypothetical protein VK196_08795 [Magnetospirillum sp.]|nr:hypothetical protein [Magnetospirillum sp.]
MLRPAALIAVLCLAATANAADGKNSGTTVILSDRDRGRTIGKVDGETVVLQSTPGGTVGKIGNDKVLLHADGRGNTVGKVGSRKMFCLTDPASGLTLCK